MTDLPDIDSVAFISENTERCYKGETPEGDKVLITRDADDNVGYSSYRAYLNGELVHSKAFPASDGKQRSIVVNIPESRTGEGGKPETRKRRLAIPLDDEGQPINEGSQWEYSDWLESMKEDDI